MADLAKESATATAAAHFLFQNSATLIRIYMNYGVMRTISANL